MDLYPAIDLRSGRCVRLLQGDYGRQTTYDGDPVEVAAGFAAAGSRWIHVVDLDAARSGQAVNRQLIGEMARAVAPVPLQVGGGVRDRAAAEALFELGVERVVIGTAAVEDPELVRALAPQRRVAIGLDARNGEIAIKGWTQAAGLTVADLLDRYTGDGVEAVVVTEISRDGTFAGPDLQGLRAVLTATSMAVIASGGVGALDDLRSLAGLSADGRRLAGAIVGKALHDGRVTVEEALAACARSG